MNDFPSTETKYSRVSVLVGLLVLLCLAPMFLLIPVAGPILAGLVALISIGVMAAGYRKGPCPHCGREGRFSGFSKKAEKCKDCGHQLRLQDKRLYDLTEKQAASAE